MSAESEDIHAQKSVCGDLACRCTVMNDHLNDDVTERMNLLQSQEMKNLIGRIRPFPQKTKKNHCRIRQIDRKTMEIFQKET